MAVTRPDSPASLARTRSYRLTCAGATDVGLKRRTNEDRFAVFPEAGLFVVSDGVGGAAAGEVASGMAVDLVFEALVDVDTTWPSGMLPRGRTGLQHLKAAIERANHCIHVAGRARPDRHGMAATVVALYACGGHRAVIAHVGDSRIYRLRGRTLEQLTEDHSLHNELVRMGLDERSANPEYRHVITRALGPYATVEVDARFVDVLPGDTFLLCSDGLSGTVEQREIASILLEHDDLDEAAARLVFRANELGGPDNITAALVRCEAAAA